VLSLLFLSIFSTRHHGRRAKLPRLPLVSLPLSSLVPHRVHHRLRLALLFTQHTSAEPGATGYAATAVPPLAWPGHHWPRQGKLTMPPLFPTRVAPPALLPQLHRAPQGRRLRAAGARGRPAAGHLWPLREHRRVRLVTRSSPASRPPPSCAPPLGIGQRAPPLLLLCSVEKKGVVSK
jgi:hypothetical protein